MSWLDKISHAITSKVEAKTRNSCGCPDDGHLQGCGFYNDFYGREKPSYTAGNRYSAYMGTPPPFRTSRYANVEIERLPLMARILDVCRNFGPAKGIIDFTVQNLAQSYTPLPKIDLKQLPGWTPEEAAEYEASFLCWHKTYLEEMKHCDSAESLNFTKMMQTFVRQLELYGEVFVLSTFLNPETREHEHRRFGSSVMFINPMRVRTPNDKRNDRANGRLLVQEGIRLNRHGKALRYYVFDDVRTDFCLWESTNRKATPIDAYCDGELSHRRKMMHFFERLEEDQIRGVSPFAASVEMLELLRQLLKDIALRAQKQTKNLGFMQTDCEEAHDPDGPPILGGGDNDPWAQYKEWAEDPELSQHLGCSDAHKEIIKRRYYHETQGTAQQFDDAGVSYIIGYPNESLTYSQVDNGRLAATELIESTYEAIATAHGYSTNQIRRNYADGNYTGQRSGRIDTERTLERKQCMTDEFAQSYTKLAGEEAFDIGILRFPRSVVEREGLDNPETRRGYVANNIDALLKFRYATPRSMIIEMKKDADGYEAMREQGLALWEDQLAETSQLTPEEYYERDVKQRKQQVQADFEVEQFRRELFGENSTDDNTDDNSDSNDSDNGNENTEE